MGNLKKVSKGQKIRDALHAEAWNDLVETSNLTLQRVLDLRDAFRGSVYPHPAVIELQNGTGVDLPIAAVVALGNPIITPTADLDTFQQRPNLIGVSPPASPSPTLFAVTLEPIVANVGDGTGGVGRAAIAGVAAVQVNFGATTDGFARPAAGTTGNLVSSPSTGVPILWPQPASTTGLQWALVRLTGVGAGSGWLFRGALVGLPQNDPATTFTLTTIQWQMATPIYDTSLLTNFAQPTRLTVPANAPAGLWEIWSELHVNVTISTLPTSPMTLQLEAQIHKNGAQTVWGGDDCRTVFLQNGLYGNPGQICTLRPHGVWQLSPGDYVEVAAGGTANQVGDDAAVHLSLTINSRYNVFGMKYLGQPGGAF